MAEQVIGRYGAPARESQRSRAACRPDGVRVESMSMAGWWPKKAQLDLQAKGTLVREPTKPLSRYRDPVT